MKNQLLTIALFALATLAISSCERCVKCEYAGTSLDRADTTELCNTNNKILNDEIRVVESTNWECEEN